jgi:transcriptional regulator with XRE-family HTH domain
VKALLDQHGLTQVQLAERLHMNQSLLSRRLSGVQHFQLSDLEALAKAFHITVPELFFDEYGQWDRRSGSERRKGERRQVRQVLYDPKVEPTAPGVKHLTYDGEKD